MQSKPTIEYRRTRLYLATLPAERAVPVWERERAILLAIKGGRCYSK